MYTIFDTVNDISIACLSQVTRLVWLYDVWQNILAMSDYQPK